MKKLILMVTMMMVLVAVSAFASVEEFTSKIANIKVEKTNCVTVKNFYYTKNQCDYIMTFKFNNGLEVWTDDSTVLHERKMYQGNKRDIFVVSYETQSNKLIAINDKRYIKYIHEELLNDNLAPEIDWKDVESKTQKSIDSYN